MDYHTLEAKYEKLLEHVKKREAERKGKFWELKYYGKLLDHMRGAA
jgi:hypothetical protein